jgi:hypothetical protein
VKTKPKPKPYIPPPIADVPRMVADLVANPVLGSGADLRGMSVEEIRGFVEWTNNLRLVMAAMARNPARFGLTGAETETELMAVIEKRAKVDRRRHRLLFRTDPGRSVRELETAFTLRPGMRPN